MWLGALLTASVIWLLFHDVASYDVPTKLRISYKPIPGFGCKNSMISDEWRTYVLNFHNKMRRNLATGKVKAANNQMAAMAVNINELLWDCNIEKHASDNMCGAALAQNYYAITETFKNKKDCNVTVQTNTLLKSWWSQSTAIDLKQSQDYTADAEQKAPKFSHVISAKLV
ncbi:hypothetical protein Y032_0522g2889 [Ancylostoma ceylanicum]|nr:hypothetical protein Y032_0522g2889 [Ancylostoma ceylanicum]